MATSRLHLASFDSSLRRGQGRTQEIDRVTCLLPPASKQISWKTKTSKNFAHSVLDKVTLLAKDTDTHDIFTASKHSLPQDSTSV